MTDTLDINALKALYSGKAKTLYETQSPNHLMLLFRDDTSAFDGKQVAQLAQKGKVNNYFNAHIMKLLQTSGIETHFEKLIDERRSLVKKLKMFPLEAVVRNIAAGGLCKRLGIEEGVELKPPIFEFFLKNDALGDPLVNESHIESFAWADSTFVADMKSITLKVNEILKQHFLEADLLLVDYKLEFGLYEGRVVLADEVTPDGCRLWDAKTRAKLDKDRFRQGLGNVVESYLEVAKRLGVPELSKSD